MTTRPCAIRRLAALSFVVASVALAACTPPPAPGGSGGWPGAGCVKGSNDGTTVNPDIRFSGKANVRGNGVMSGSWVNGQFEFSTNGTCSGAPIAALTIVKAADEATATTTCTTLNAGTDPAVSYEGTVWNLPDDAWACSETYFL